MLIFQSAHCSIDVITEAFKNASQLLRKGGAFVVDHRNFLPAILHGKMNRNGFNPCSHVSTCRQCSQFYIQKQLSFIPQLNSSVFSADLVLKTLETQGTALDAFFISSWVS